MGADHSTSPGTAPTETPSGASPLWAWTKPLATLLTLYLFVSTRYDAQPLIAQASPLSALGFVGQVLPFVAVAVTATVLLAFRETRQRLLPVHARYPAPAGARPLLLHALSAAPFLWTTHLVFTGGPLSAPKVAAWVLSTLAVGLTAVNLAVPFRGQIALIRALSIPLLLGMTLGGVAWLSGHLAGQLWAPMADVTLKCVDLLLRLIGQPVQVIEGTRIIGLKHFTVDIAPECSGYEGVGLIAMFLGAYLWKSRDELRFPAAYWLLGLGVVAVWAFNNVRIAALLLVGEYVSPSVALGGFHSKAGWLLFCGISIGMVAMANRIPWLHEEPAKKPEAVERPAGPYLLPLIVLLSVSLLTGLITPGFDYAYPLRALAGGAAAALSLSVFRPDSLRPTLWALACGVLVFALWIWMVPADPADDARFDAALQSMPDWGRLTWMALRVLGASVVIPIVEELAFRGFLLRRLVQADFERLRYTSVPLWALALSSLAFGALHSAWIAGTLAGIAYGLVLMRTGRLYDAIFAHGLTNALLAAYVMTTGHWSLW